MTDQLALFLVAPLPPPPKPVHISAEGRDILRLLVDAPGPLAAREILEMLREERHDPFYRNTGAVELSLEALWRDGLVRRRRPQDEQGHYRWSATTEEEAADPFAYMREGHD